MKKTILLALFVLFFGGLARAATRLVPAQYSTIQAAIDNCNDGDEVIVADGVYTGEGNFNIDFSGKVIKRCMVNFQDFAVIPA